MALRFQVHLTTGQVILKGELGFLLTNLKLSCFILVGSISFSQLILKYILHSQGSMSRPTKASVCYVKNPIVDYGVFMLFIWINILPNLNPDFISQHQHCKIPLPAKALPRLFSQVYQIFGSAYVVFRPQKL